MNTYYVHSNGTLIAETLHHHKVKYDMRDIMCFVVKRDRRVVVDERDNTEYEIPEGLVTT